MAASPETAALNAMLAVLDQYRVPLALPPAPPPPLPLSSLALVSMEKRVVGLGDRRGTDSRGHFSVAALKGIRIEAVIRYQIWTTNPGDVDLAIQNLITRLLGDRDVLKAAGFLSLALKNTGTSENVPLNAWRESVEFEVLYEFPYSDSDGAESLISQIKIGIDGEIDESTTVTDEMTRWDDESAPALVLRGPLSVGELSALAFIQPGLPPSKGVTLTRTFDGAISPTPVHPDLASLWAAITRPNNPDRQGQVGFASLSSFLAAFSVAGSSFTLGDWKEDHIPDEYESRALIIEPALKLPSGADRFEITYETAAFDHVAVVYLRATRGTTT